MSAFLNVNEIKEKVSLLGLLKNLGFSPQKVSGGEHFFLSMLREEYTASLCVNEELGVWFDHGGAGVSGIRSGSVIDFGMAYWYPSSFPEVLSKIVEYAEVSLEKSEEIAKVNLRRRNPVRVPSYSIESINELGNNHAITSYLRQRGVDKVANGHIFELDYYVVDDKNRRKNFFAAGWPNENGGWEVRNRYFKGCLGHKGMSFLQGSIERISIFEGYLDFLSWKVEHPDDPASILVLNSLSFLMAAKSRAKAFGVSELYFDHDKAGASAAKEFLSEVKGSIDCSSNYAHFKDYNEYLVAKIKEERKSIDRPMSFSVDQGFSSAR